MNEQEPSREPRKYEHNSEGLNYITDVIIYRHEQTAIEAQNGPYNHQAVDDAVFYDSLYNFPTPGESPDDEGLK